MIDKITLKQWFERGKKPTAAQFASWMESYWHKSEQLPISKIEQLPEALAQKLDVGILQEHIDGNTTVFLPIHALVNSMNITEELTITGVACNRNCKSVIFIDKEDPLNMLPVEIVELEEEPEDLTEDPTENPEDPMIDPENPIVDPEDPMADPEDPMVDPENPMADPEDPMVDPEDPTNGLEYPEEEPEEEYVEIRKGISLAQFMNKTVYVLASEINAGEGIDISLTLKKTVY